MYKGPVPPTGVTVKLPFDNPKQLTFNELVIEAVGLPVFKMLYVTTKVQVLASFINTVCVPAVKPAVTVAAVKSPPSNDCWYGANPPDTAVNVAEPLALPQLALVVVTVADVGPVVPPTTNVALNKQPFTSFTVIECVPAGKLVVKLPVDIVFTLKV